MRFGSLLGLLVAFLVVAPVVAHLLRRRKTETVAFPFARLVALATPIARRRSQLEDRALFATRALAVLMLALLGASPFVRCSRLAVGRQGGGSIAMVLVVDDSLSMRAALGSGTRFSRAIAGAREVLGSAREGDGVAIVAAGAPARVVVAATTDLATAVAALDTLHEADRATDLDGALVLATSLVRSLPHPDKRIVLLSDLADGHHGGPPIGEIEGVPVWVPIPELRGDATDCAVLRADRKAGRVRAAIACSRADAAVGREIQCVAGKAVVATAKLVTERTQVVELAPAAGDDGAPQRCTTVRLAGADAIPADDEAPVVPEAGPVAVAVVGDPNAPQGHATTVERGLGAIDETLSIRPLPTVPDDADDLAAFGGVVLDDPPGLTPEARAAFRAWMERGGAGLVLLGPRAGAAILGAAFDPFVPGPVRWVTTAPKGVDVASAGALGSAAEGLAALDPKGRAVLEAKAEADATVLARWSDKAPFALTRAVGRGSATAVTLPASLDVSDFPLRPAFLELLDRVVEAARAHGERPRIAVGTPITLRGVGDVTAEVGTEPLPKKVEAGAQVVVPDRAGLVALHHDGATEYRVAEVAESEIDFVPRAAAGAATDEALGSAKASIDVSPYVAMTLLLVVALEAAFRLRAGAGPDEPQPASRA